MCAVSGVSEAKSQNVSWAEDHVQGLGLQRDEVIEGIVRRRGLGDLDVGLGLGGVDQVGELDAVLDEEHRDVVADQIEVALFGVELSGKAAGIARRVGGPARADDRREAHKHRGFDGRILEEGSTRVLRHRLVHLENTVDAGAASVDHTLRNAFVVEVRHLLTVVEVLQETGAALASLEGVLVVADAQPGVGGQELSVGHTGDLRCLLGIGCSGSRRWRLRRDRIGLLGKLTWPT